MASTRKPLANWSFSTCHDLRLRLSSQVNLHPSENAIFRYLEMAQMAFCRLQDNPSRRLRGPLVSAQGQVARRKCGTHGLSSIDVTSQLDHDHFTCLDPPLTPEEDALLNEALDAASSRGDADPLTDFFLSRVDAVAPGTVTDCYGIIHDEDDAEPHFEVLMKAGRRGLDLEGYSRALGVPAQQIIHPHRGGKGFWDQRLRYLIHAGTYGKHRYPPSKVHTARGRDYVEIAEENKLDWGDADVYAAINAVVGTDQKTKRDHIRRAQAVIINRGLTREEVMADDDLRILYQASSSAAAEIDNTLAKTALMRQLVTRQLIDDGDIRMVTVFFQGESGSGKTGRVAWTLIRVLKGLLGWHVHEGSLEHPFDGYGGEEILLLDEYRPENKGGRGMSFPEALLLLDQHHVSKASARYRDQLMSCRLVVITSPLSPLLWAHYSRGNGDDASRGGPISQFLRRIDYYVEVNDPASYGYYDLRVRLLCNLHRKVAVPVTGATKTKAVFDHETGPASIPITPEVEVGYWHEQPPEVGEWGLMSVPQGLTVILDGIMRNCLFGRATPEHELLLAAVWKTYSERYETIRRENTQYPPLPPDPSSVRNVIPEREIYDQFIAPRIEGGPDAVRRAYSPRLFDFTLGLGALGDDDARKEGLTPHLVVTRNDWLRKVFSKNPPLVRDLPCLPASTTAEAFPLLPPEPDGGDPRLGGATDGGDL